MKYLLIIPDGAADHSLPELNNKTPLAYADTPTIDYLAETSLIGQVKTIPDDIEPGSDIAIMQILGYEAKKYYTGRGPLEAKAKDVPLSDVDVIFRCNLISSDGENIIDYSAGHITTEEAYVLMEKISSKLETDKIKFYPGVSYRQLMRWRGGVYEEVDRIKCIPPHDIQGKRIRDYLPPNKILQQLIWNSIEILDNHDINKKRRDKGLLPANMIWLWGQGKIPTLPSFFDKYKLRGACICAVDLIKGLGAYIGLDYIKVPGVTGYYDTNFEGKGEYAASALSSYDFVFIHLEAIDEASHNGDLEKKIEMIENFDKRLLNKLIEGLKKTNYDYKILLLPDHLTPLSIKTHTHGYVPFMIHQSNKKLAKQKLLFNEIEAATSDIKIEAGEKLLNFFINY